MMYAPPGLVADYPAQLRLQASAAAAAAVRTDFRTATASLAAAHPFAQQQLSAAVQQQQLSLAAALAEGQQAFHPVYLKPERRVGGVRVGKAYWTEVGRGRAPHGKKQPAMSRDKKKVQNLNPGISAIGMLIKDLDGKDPACVIKFRKVHQLGSGGLQALRTHCEFYGGVDDALALQPPQMGMGRLRPSTLAFVVMSDLAGAQAVLAAGREHTILQQKVFAEQYEHRDGPEAVQCTRAEQYELMRQKLFAGQYQFQSCTQATYAETVAAEVVDSSHHTSARTSGAAEWLGAKHRGGEMASDFRIAAAEMAYRRGYCGHYERGDYGGSDFGQLGEAAGSMGVTSEASAWQTDVLSYERGRWRAWGAWGAQEPQTLTATSEDVGELEEAASSMGVTSEASNWLTATDAGGDKSATTPAALWLSAKRGGGDLESLWSVAVQEAERVASEAAQAGADLDDSEHRGEADSDALACGQAQNVTSISWLSKKFVDRDDLTGRSLTAEQDKRREKGDVSDAQEAARVKTVACDDGAGRADGDANTSGVNVIGILCDESLLSKRHDDDDDTLSLPLTADPPEDCRLSDFDFWVTDDEWD